MFVYDAIKISDVQRSQLQSSARVLGLKEVGNKEELFDSYCSKLSHREA